MKFHFNCANIKAYFEDEEIDPWRKLRTFIPKEQYDGNIGGTSAVVMRLTESVKPDKHPSLGSNISPSQQAESGYFPENSHRVNVYDHWVALELFKVWEYLQEAHLDFHRENISIKFDDAYMSSLQTAVACVEESIKEDPKKGSNLGAFVRKR